RSKLRRSYETRRQGCSHHRRRERHRSRHRQALFGSRWDLGRNAKSSMKGEAMKIVVIGGTGLIGSKVVSKLTQLGHEVLAAAPNTGVNTITGEGLAEALEGAQVVVDLANSPSFEDQAAMDFFQTAGKNLIEAEKAAGVQQHV